MKNIHAKSPQNLVQELSKFNVKVPKRTGGRQTHHTELWTITRFLSTYAATRIFSYPIEILHRDKPDFLINTSDKKIGIEITEAIPEQYAYVVALAEKYYPNSRIEPSMFTRDNPKRSKKELLEILEKSQHKLSGLPIYGYKIEVDWAEWIFEDVILKTNKLNSKSFDKFESNFLLIYDNLPHVANDIYIQLEYLQLKIANYWNTDNTFDAIYIISGGYIIELNGRYEDLRLIVDIWK